MFDWFWFIEEGYYRIFNLIFVIDNTVDSFILMVIFYIIIFFKIKILFMRSSYVIFASQIVLLSYSFFKWSASAAHVFRSCKEPWWLLCMSNRHRVCLQEVCVSFQIMLDALACLPRFSLNSARRPAVEAPTTSYDYGFGYKVQNGAFFSKVMYIRR